MKLRIILNQKGIEMSQAFVVVLRESFEAFLIVAIIMAYLEKTRRPQLLPAVYWGIGGSIGLSTVLAIGMVKTANEPLWEGIFGLLSALLVGGLVIQMWMTAAHLKRDMENRLTQRTVGKTDAVAFWGIFLFTALMISREGMEMVLLLLQIHDPRLVTGILLGILAAVALAVLWERFSYLINLKIFFQVTSVFLLLLVIQILIYSFHEFTEAGVFPNSEALHEASEAFSPNSQFGKIFSLLTIGGCGLWLIGAWLMDRFRSQRPVGGSGN